MQQKRAFVTGVGRGLGRAIAQQLHEDGYEVWGSTRDGTTDLDIAGCVAFDLVDETSIVAGLASFAEQRDSLDLLVNCAGTDARSFGAPENTRGAFDVDGAAFNSVMMVNVTGPMLVSRELLPVMRQGRDPMIINISSQLGSMQVAARKGRDASYCVSKAALNMWSIKASAELQTQGVGVVMVHPGWVQTDMGGPNAELTIDESASAIVSTIQSLSLDDTGRFVRWDGHDHPW